jgi:hypothetical protein
MTYIRIVSFLSIIFFNTIISFAQDTSIATLKNKCDTISIKWYGWKMHDQMLTFDHVVNYLKSTNDLIIISLADNAKKYNSIGKTFLYVGGIVGLGWLIYGYIAYKGDILKSFNNPVQTGVFITAVSLQWGLGIGFFVLRDSYINKGSKAFNLLADKGQICYFKIPDRIIPCLSLSF